MASSYHSKVRSTQNKGVTVLLFGTWTLALFPHVGEQLEGRGDLVELGHFDKHFIKSTRKKGPTKEKFLINLLLKTTFLMKNLVQR